MVQSIDTIKKYPIPSVNTAKITRKPIYNISTFYNSYLLLFIYVLFILEILFMIICCIFILLFKNSGLKTYFHGSVMNIINFIMNKFNYKNSFYIILVIHIMIHFAYFGIHLVALLMNIFDRNIIVAIVHRNAFALMLLTIIGIIYNNEKRILIVINAFIILCIHIITILVRVRVISKTKEGDISYVTNINEHLDILNNNIIGLKSEGINLQKDFITTSLGLEIDNTNQYLDTASKFTYTSSVLTDSINPIINNIGNIETDSRITPIIETTWNNTSTSSLYDTAYNNIDPKFVVSYASIQDILNEYNYINNTINPEIINQKTYLDMLYDKVTNKIKTLSSNDIEAMKTYDFDSKTNDYRHRMPHKIIDYYSITNNSYFSIFDSFPMNRNNHYSHTIYGNNKLLFYSNLLYNLSSSNLPLPFQQTNINIQATSDKNHTRVNIIIDNSMTIHIDISNDMIDVNTYDNNKYIPFFTLVNNHIQMRHRFDDTTNMDTSINQVSFNSIYKPGIQMIRCHLLDNEVELYTKLFSHNTIDEDDQFRVVGDNIKSVSLSKITSTQLSHLPQVQMHTFAGSYRVDNISHITRSMIFDNNGGVTGTYNKGTQQNPNNKYQIAEFTYSSSSKAMDCIFDGNTSEDYEYKVSIDSINKIIKLYYKLYTSSSWSNFYNYSTI